MPHRSLTKCTYPGCQVLVHGGRCNKHSTKRVERDPAAKKLYNSRRWRSMRAAQLAAHPWCVTCESTGALVIANEVDHVVPHGGDPALFFDASNLQSLCKPHHSSKTREEVWGKHDDPPVEKSFHSPE